VEKWICVKDERGKLKLLQRAQRIYTCRDKTEDRKRVFNFGILASLKSEFCEREISDLTFMESSYYRKVNLYYSFAIREC